MNYLENAEFIANKTKTTKVIRFFPETDLRSMHLGLRKVAMKHGIDVWALNPGEFVVFANTKQTGLKIFAPGNVIAYVKSPDDKKIDLRVIALIPRYFNGSKFHYEGALREMITKKLAA